MLCLRRNARAALMALGLMLGTALPAQAGLIVSVATDLTAAAGSTGNWFDVFLENTGPNPISLDSFNVTLFVAPGSGIVFTGADGGDPIGDYIFSGNSFGLLFNKDPMAPPSVDIGDGIAAAPDAGNVPAGTKRLGRIYYDVLLIGAAPGDYAIGIDGSTTFTLQATFEAAPYSVANGLVTIQATAAPEPASLALAAVGGGLLALAARRRR